jgi:hypothetical protein
MGSLAELSVDELAERLVTLAQHARKLSGEDASVVLHEMLAEVRNAADAASGEVLALLEVAEAFLRTLARSDLGKAELALRRFVVDHGEIAESVFSQLVDLRNVPLAEIEKLEPAVRARFDVLFELGVLRRKVDGNFDLRPSMRALARDLLEPEVIRMWRRVQKARAFAGASRMKEVQAAHFLASQLAVTAQQAGSFLKTDPVVGMRSNDASAEGDADRLPVCRVVYRRATRARIVSDQLGTADAAELPVVAAIERHQQSDEAPGDVLRSIVAQPQETLN